MAFTDTDICLYVCIYVYMYVCMKEGKTEGWKEGMVFHVAFSSKGSFSCRRTLTLKINISRGADIKDKH